MNNSLEQYMEVLSAIQKELITLKRSCQRHPIKELNGMTSKERLIQSLERGNLHQVTFVKGDKEEKMHVEANPLFKTWNIYDENRKKVFQENRKQPIVVPVGKK